MPNFQLPKTRQDQRLRIRVNNAKFVSTNWVRFYRESLGKTKFVARQDGRRGLEVPQADQNDINVQWSLFFTDLDELLSEYEQHRSTHDIAVTENAVRALQKCGISLCITD